MDTVRKRIVQLGSPLDNFYSTEFAKGVAQRANALGYDLVYLSGGLQHVFFDGALGPCHFNEGRSSLVYQIPRGELFDAVVLWGAQWQHDANEETMLQMLEKFRPSPVVSVGWATEGIYGVFLDNSTGMKELIRHLIEAHGHTKIAYLKSESSQPQREADERYEGFKQAHVEAGIRTDDRLVVFGNEIEEVRKKSLEEHSIAADWAVLAIEELLDTRKLVPGKDFTALATRDDVAALSALEVLKKRGYRVPQDVAIIGFDGLISGRCASPPLTTVTQSFFDQGAAAVDVVHRIFQGEPVPPETIMEPARPLIRESCGCLNRILRLTSDPSSLSLSNRVSSIEALLRSVAIDFSSPEQMASTLKLAAELLEDEGRDPMELIAWLEYKNQNQAIEERQLRSAQVFVGDLAQRYQLAQRVAQTNRRELIEGVNRDIFRTYDLETVLSSVTEELSLIGSLGCSIVTYDDPNHPFAGGKLILSSDQKGNRLPRQSTGLRFEVRELLPPGYWPSRTSPVSLFVEAIFFADFRIGYMVMERGKTDGREFSSLSTRLGAALQGAFLVRNLNAKQEELIKAYSEILTLSNTDPLTGLHNRRSFQNELATEHRRMERYSKDFEPTYVLMYLDLDNFKHCNDTFGHETGDAALQAFSELLRACCRTTDIIARFGGDEFAILFPETSLEGASVVAQRILDQMKATSYLVPRIRELTGIAIEVGERDTITCSIGLCAHNSSMTMEGVLKLADEAMYKSKQAGKNCFRSLPESDSRS